MKTIILPDDCVTVLTDMLNSNLNGLFFKSGIYWLKLKYCLSQLEKQEEINLDNITEAINDNLVKENELLKKELMNIKFRYYRA